MANLDKGDAPDEYYNHEGKLIPVFWPKAAWVDIADAGGRFTGTEVEAALQELAGSGRTTETVKENANASPPIGAIIAWHKTMTGVPALPGNWLECDGSVISDGDSPMNGETLPDLNGETAFIRGGAASSNTKEGDAMQGHDHQYQRGGFREGGGSIYQVVYGGAPSTIDFSAPSENGSYGLPRTADETRPINMTMVWIIRIK
jgi:hypothetical protein